MPDHVLWRDPDGRHYVLSRPGLESELEGEGYAYFETVEAVRVQLRDMPTAGVVPGSELWTLMRDVQRYEAGFQGEEDQP